MQICEYNMQQCDMQICFPGKDIYTHKYIPVAINFCFIP